MPIIYPNTSDMVDFSPIEPGPYRAKIAEVEVTTSKKSGHGMLVVKCLVDVGGREYTRSAYVMTEGKGAGNFDQLLRACNFGSQADAIKAGGEVPFDTDDLIGQDVVVLIKHELDQNGQTRDRIDSFIAA